MPRRPCAGIRDRCPIERVSPNHTPPVAEPVPLRQNCGTLSSLLSTLSSPLCLPSHTIPSADPAIRPSLALALRLSRSRQTISATAGMDSPPDCSHPNSAMHPMRGCIPYCCPPLARPFIPRSNTRPTDNNRSLAILKIPVNPENPDSDNDHPKNLRCTQCGYQLPAALQEAYNGASYATAVRIAVTDHRYIQNASPG